MRFIVFVQSKLLLLLSFTAYFAASFPITLAQGQTSDSEIVSKETTAKESELNAVNYSNAKPLNPVLKTRPNAVPEESAADGTPGFVKGSAPTEAPNAIKGVQLAPARGNETTAGLIKPTNFGTLNHPFTTARVATRSRAVNPATVFPYLPAGKLFFKIGASTFVCSASVIKPRVVVTAAHCVSEFGTNTFYNSFRFVPGYTNGKAPVGVWTYKRVFVKGSYLKGTDNCFPGAVGVVCANDVAVFVMNDQGGKKIGDVTGTFGYGFNGFGYTRFLKARVNQLTQLGYPVDLDQGVLMQRNDSLSYVDKVLARNQIIGSLMTGGSSGGPWLVNFGIAPSAPGIDAGQAPGSNIVVGVSSWGYVSSSLKEMGASRFTDRNIVPLVKEACQADPGNC